MMRSSSSATLRISVSAHSEPRSSMKWRRARALAVTKIIVSVALGRTERAAWRASLRRGGRASRRAAGGPVPPARELLHQPGDEVEVRLVRLLDGAQPDRVQPLVPGDEAGLDVVRHRLVDVALGELGVAPAGAVADELVGEGAGDAGDDEVPDGVLEDGAVFLADDVADVLRVGLAPFSEREVAEATARLGELLAAHLRVRFPAPPAFAEEAVDGGAVDVLASD